MFSKLKANYNLSNVLVRIFYVLAVVLSTWQTYLGVVYYGYSEYVAEMLGQLNGSAKLAIALMSALVSGLALMFLTKPLVNLFLNVSKIYSVPRAEYCLLANLFCAMGFFINGLLNLINLITPVFMVWGGIIFPFIITLGCFVSFYFVTSKMYFNDVTQVHYFKCLSVVAIIVLVLEVL